MTTELETLVAKLGIKVTSKYIGPKNDAMWKGANEYQVTLSYKRKKLTTSFYQGSALTNDPSASDVLYCLASDASVSASFEDWCGEMGYDYDSRRMYAVWEECRAMKAKLERFIGSEIIEKIIAWEI